MSDFKNEITLLHQRAIEERDKTDILQLAQQIVQDLGVDEEKNFIQDVGDFFPRLKSRVDGTEECEVVPTGFRDIDNRIYGVAKGNIMTIAARTGGGKTTLGLNMAVNMSKEHIIGFISLEMTKDELLDKIVSRVCKVRASSLNINRFSSVDVQNMRQYGEEAKRVVNSIILATDCFFIDDIVSVMNQMADQGAEVIFIDWLGMIEAEGREKKDQLRAAMRKIKQVALNRNVGVVAMQQLNREADNSPSGPFLRQISDSSAIEHISAPVLMLRRSGDFDKVTDIRLFKMRRLNSDLLEKMYDDKTILDPWYDFANIRLGENLAYCEFTDFNPTPTT